MDQSGLHILEIKVGKDLAYLQNTNINSSKINAYLPNFHATKTSPEYYRLHPVNLESRGSDWCKPAASLSVGIGYTLPKNNSVTDQFTWMLHIRGEAHKNPNAAPVVSVDRDPSNKEEEQGIEADCSNMPSRKSQGIAAQCWSLDFFSCKIFTSFHLPSLVAHYSNSCPASSGSCCGSG